MGTLVIPTLLGPVLLLVLAPSLTWCHRRHEAEEAEDSGLAPSEQVPSPGFTLALTATFLLCYSLNLVISELYIQDSFAFLLVKNTLGYAHLVFVPLLILACHQDIRRGIGKV